MAGIMVFEKNKVDLDLDAYVTITITDAVASDTGQSVVDYLRNRNNYSGWGTAGSTDAANTQLDITFPETEITDILLVEHNLKAYTIKYWNGAAYVDFSTAIAETTNSATTTHYNFTQVTTSIIRIIITGTIVVNDDKKLAQLIVTDSMGQFETYPDIKNPMVSRNRKEIKTISGKSKIIRNVGAFSCNLELDNVISENDLAIIEDMFESDEGFLVWLCGGDTTQFRTQRFGYRLQDIFLMQCKNEYSPEWANGFYKHGTKMQANLVETV